MPLSFRSDCSAKELCFGFNNLACVKVNERIDNGIVNVISRPDPRLYGKANILRRDLEAKVFPSVVILFKSSSFTYF